MRRLIGFGLLALGIVGYIALGTISDSPPDPNAPVILVTGILSYLWMVSGLITKLTWILDKNMYLLSAVSVASWLALCIVPRLMDFPEMTGAVFSWSSVLYILWTFAWPIADGYDCFQWIMEKNKQRTK